MLRISKSEVFLLSLLREAIKYSKDPKLILPRLMKKAIVPFNYFFVKNIPLFHSSTFTQKQEKPILLFGAFGGRRYDDNSASLFEYMTENEPDYDCYWVIRKDSLDDERKIPYEQRIVYKDTIKGCLFARKAAAFIYTHGRYDITDFKKADTPSALNIMLDHGFTSLKKTTMDKLSTGELAAKDLLDWDLIVSGSEAEACIHNRQWCVPKEKIALAGLARYDRLDAIKKDVHADGRSILYMPTWREWNAKKISLAKTDFFTQIKSFLVDSALDDFLFERGITLYIYVHMWMREFFTEFRNNFSLKSTLILDQGADLQKMLAGSSLFITDYSSVAWDFLYLDRPVLFYQFDLEKYMEQTGAYIDMKKDLFGPAAYCPEEAAGWVKYFVENDYSTELFSQKMDAGKKYAFAYSDGKNCSRISGTIKKMLAEAKILLIRTA